jgi:hypothetical protein
MSPRELHESTQGALTTNIELEAASERLQDLTSPLLQQRGDEMLKQICTGCVEVSKELVKRLEKPKISERHKHKKWKSFRQALKSVAGKDKIEEVKGRFTLSEWSWRRTFY